MTMAGAEHPHSVYDGDGARLRLDGPGGGAWGANGESCRRYCPVKLCEKRGGLELERGGLQPDLGR